MGSQEMDPAELLQTKCVIQPFVVILVPSFGGVFYFRTTPSDTGEVLLAGSGTIGNASDRTRVYCLPGKCPSFLLCNDTTTLFSQLWNGTSDHPQPPPLAESLWVIYTEDLALCRNRDTGVFQDLRGGSLKERKLRPKRKGGKRFGYYAQTYSWLSTQELQLVELTGQCGMLGVEPGQLLAKQTPSLLWLQL